MRKMPSEHERRRLEEIEAALRASDPGLDRALRTFRPRRTGLVAGLIFAWLALAGIGLTRWWVFMFILVGPLLALSIFTLRPPWRVAPEPVTGNGTGLAAGH
jgi:hypothetical protein